MVCEPWFFSSIPPSRVDSRPQLPDSLVVHGIQPRQHSRGTVPEHLLEAGDFHHRQHHATATLVMFRRQLGQFTVLTIRGSAHVSVSSAAYGKSLNRQMSSGRRPCCSSW